MIERGAVEQPALRVSPLIKGGYLKTWYEATIKDKSTVEQPALRVSPLIRGVRGVKKVFSKSIGLEGEKSPSQVH